MGTKFTGIIPARYGSRRFPGKPLALLRGTPMIIRVWERVKSCLDEVYIATDNDEIRLVAEKAGAKVIMTSESHVSGTDRVCEAAGLLFPGSGDHDRVIVNIQGDEPLIDCGSINNLCGAFMEKEVDIATLIHRIKREEDLINPNRVKVVTDRSGNALYFSRARIPHSHQDFDINLVNYYQHIGTYAYRINILKKLASLETTMLEEAEKLEQLRWLCHGYKIRCVETSYNGFGVDTPEDLEALNRLI
jgi:3-deoxy-manno-octulosonate cytidylyltransferase (CMP-KDO synthetase)